ncbi:MAG: TRAM domain-containing protein [Clostridiales bacterium]|nr:TRAM domain-containing protein [Clostridiales bacterium]
MMEKTATYEVEITGYGAGGEGVGRLPDGRAVFVPRAARGDVLALRLREEKARSARGEIDRILAPSPWRIEGDCPLYPRCGGCDFRHITYEEELQAKLKRVNDALARIGGLPAVADEILTTGQTAGYRNKAVLHTDGISRGFYAAQSRVVIPVDRCLLLKEDINSALKDLPQPPRKGEITLRSGRNGLHPPLEEELDGLVFRISGFFQVNTGAALLLYQKAREYAAMPGDGTLIDLYCGVGSLTLFVGRDAGRGIGVEQNPGAVVAARENARRNGLSHIEFYAINVEKWESTIKEPHCVVVDPPRKGLSPGALRLVLSMSPKRIVYVSCDPATFARDLRLLTGYEIKALCAVDMFPRTANVECCCLLVKK